MIDFESLNTNFTALSSNFSSNETVEMTVKQKESLSISHNKGALEKYSFSDTHAASIRVIVQGNEGYASTENFSHESLKSCYQQAAQNARMLMSGTKETETAFDLPKNTKIDPKNPPKNILSAQIKITDSQLAKLSNKEKIELSKQMETYTLSADKRVKSAPYNGYSEGRSRASVFNSHGIAVCEENSHCTLYAIPLVEENGIAKMGYRSPRVYFDPTQLNPKEIARESAEISLRKLNPKELNSGHYLTHFEPEAISSFFSHMSQMFSGQAIFEKKSPLTDKIGKSIGHSMLNIHNIPQIEGSCFSQYFDAEGSPCFDTAVVDQGNFVTPLTNAKWAAKLGLKNTASATHPAHGNKGIGFAHMKILGGLKPREELLNLDSSMLTITELGGMAAFNTVSGNFSIPASGFWLQNGKIMHSVDNFVISSNVFDFLANIVEVGNDVEIGRSSVCAPSMVIKDLSVAGT